MQALYQEREFIMGLNDTPSGVRVHIGFFGRRNAGKSSVMNAVTGQDLAVVSEEKGTTTDPVQKAMELLPLGPVLLIDTPGWDDEGGLGEKRIQKTRQILNKTDIAILVVDSTEGFLPCDMELLELFRQKKIPHLIAWNKVDLLSDGESADLTGQDKLFDEIKDLPSLRISAASGQGIHELKEALARMSPTSEEKHLVADLIQPGDLIILVIPIDSAAPKGRLILPQQQAIRDILDAGACAIVVKEDELSDILTAFRKKPALVITDSQAFQRVSADTPADIPLTSFSILMARYKGFLSFAVDGVKAIDQLQDGDRILISEGCTHHRQCEDIGTVKLPKWLKNYTKKELIIETSSGTQFPEDLSPYALIIHCGGCMLNQREVIYRAACARDQGIPMTNYGTAIAHMNGILRRSLQPIPDL